MIHSFDNGLFNSNSHTTKMKYTHIIFIIISVFASSCQLKKEDTIFAQSTIYPLEQSVVINKLDNYIDTIVAVPLETSSQSLLGNITKILLTSQGDIIISSASQIFVFNPDGTFSHLIGKHGRGSSENPGIMDMCLSQDNQYILVLDCINDVHKYKLSDGNFIQKYKIKLPDGYSDFHRICPGKEGGFYLYCCNKFGSSEKSETFYCLIEYDDKGEKINQHIQGDTYILPISPITQTYNNEYLVRPQESDHICYRLKDNRVIPWLKIDFQRENIPESLVKLKFSEEFDIKDFMFSDYCKLPIYIYNISEYLYFSYCGPEAQNSYFIYSQNSKKGIRWMPKSSDDFDSYLPYFVASDSIYFYSIFNDYTDYKDDVMILEKINDPLKKYIIEKTTPKIDEDNNPYLMKIKFKF